MTPKEFKNDGKKMTDMIKRRNELAEKQAEKAFGEYSEIENEEEQNAFLAIVTDFRLGFDAGVAEMQAQNDALKAQVDELKQELANVDRAVLIAERRVHGDQADKMEASQEAAHYNWLDGQNESLKAQLKSKDYVIDVAVKALEKIQDDHFVAEYSSELRNLKKISRTTLEQIQKMRGGG